MKDSQTRVSSLLWYPKTGHVLQENHMAGEVTAEELPDWAFDLLVSLHGGDAAVSRGERRGMSVQVHDGLWLNGGVSVWVRLPAYATKESLECAALCCNAWTNSRIETAYAELVKRVKDEMEGAE